MNLELVCFDLENDVLMALENLGHSLTKVQMGNLNHFKWALVFGHTALQSSMCLSLITSGSFLIRKRDSYHNESGDLDNIEWLYQKLQNADILPFVGSKTLPHEPNELEEIKRLQTVRNTFIHQQSSLYVFTSRELLALVSLTIKLTRFLISESERLSIGAFVSKAKLETQLSSVEQLLTKQLSAD